MKTNHPDTQYKNILQSIINHGVMQGNRTNYEAQFIPSATITWDLRNGFPALTTKRLYFKQSISEILGFLRGTDNAADFRALGCNFWNSDANENKAWLNSPYRKGTDDLGCVYGVTWRKREVTLIGRNDTERSALEADGYVRMASDRTTSGYPSMTFHTKIIDQLHDCISLIINNPENRRNIMHAWFPELFPRMALPPCHVMYEFVPDAENKILHMTMTQRSCDTALGVPMNLFGSALVLALVAKATGYTAGQFSHHMTNVHLYSNQIEPVQVQMKREPLKLPELEITKEAVDTSSTDEAIKWLETISPDEVKIVGYIHHPAIEKIEMAQEK